MKKRLVILIHGLGGSGEETWGRMPQLIEQDSDLGPRFDVAFYNYPSSKWRLPFGKKQSCIPDLAKGLATEIKNHLSEEEYSRIVLVGHSLGGLIARQYVLERALGRRDLELVHRVVLLASPHYGAQLASIGNVLSWNNSQLRQLAKNSDFLTGLNDSWLELDIEQQIPVHYVIAGLDKIVSKESARGYAKAEQIEFIPDADHQSIAKPATSESLVFRTMKRLLGPRESLY